MREKNVVSCLSAKIIPYVRARPNDVRKYGTAHVRMSTAGAARRWTGQKNMAVKVGPYISVHVTMYIIVSTTHTRFHGNFHRLELLEGQGWTTLIFCKGELRKLWIRPMAR